MTDTINGTIINKDLARAIVGAQESGYTVKLLPTGNVDLYSRDGFLQSRQSRHDFVQGFLLSEKQAPVENENLRRAPWTRFFGPRAPR